MIPGEGGGNLPEVLCVCGKCLCGVLRGVVKTPTHCLFTYIVGYTCSGLWRDWGSLCTNDNTVNVDIFACKHFHRFVKMGNSHVMNLGFKYNSLFRLL